MDEKLKPSRGIIYTMWTASVILIYSLIIMDFAFQLTELLPLFEVKNMSWTANFACYLALIFVYAMSTLLGYITAIKTPECTQVCGRALLVAILLLGFIYSTDSLFISVPLSLGFILGTFDKEGDSQPSEEPRDQN